MHFAQIAVLGYSRLESACGASHLGELLRMANGLNRKIYVQLWPVEVLGRRLLDMNDFADWCIAKPGELFERQKKLFPPKEQPEAML